MLISTTFRKNECTNTYVLEAVSSIFCDNDILYYGLPFQENNVHLDNCLKAHLQERTNRIKRILNDIGINVSENELLDNSIRQYI